ncbi:hypothetical protein ACJW8B_03360 [Plesiomonas shigelloides]|uniref:hypothetical protein n=1 Tax=Plesiomonas shigelloides TaxID=703 RepID=UPI00387F3549
MPIETIKTAFESMRFLQQMFDGHVDGLAKERVDELKQEANKKVIDIQQAMIQLQAQVYEYQNENEELKKILSDTEEIKAKLEAYTLTDSIGGAIVYKYNSNPEHYCCPQCISEKKVVSILQFVDDFSGFYVCSGCKTRYKIGATKSISCVSLL